MTCEIGFIGTLIILLAGYGMFRTFEFAIRRNIKFVKEHRLGAKGK